VNRGGECASASISTSGNLLLFDTIFSDPDLGTVSIRTIADDYKLENGIVRDEIELVVELPHEGRSFSRKVMPMASRSGSASRELSPCGAHSRQRGENRDRFEWVLGRQGHAIRSAEQNSDMRGVQVHHAGWNGIPLYGLVDGGKENDVPGDMNNERPPARWR